MRKYKIAGCIIIVMGILKEIDAYIKKDFLYVLLGISFIIIGLDFYFKENK